VVENIEISPEFRQNFIEVRIQFKRIFGTMSEHIIGGRKEDVHLTRAPSLPVDKPKDYLKNTKCSSLFPEGRLNIITVQSTTSVSDGFKVQTQGFQFTFLDSYW
jgi:hypothetical protein